MKELKTAGVRLPDSPLVPYWPSRWCRSVTSLRSVLEPTDWASISAV